LAYVRDIAENLAPFGGFWGRAI